MSFRLGIVGLCTSHPEKWIPLLRDLRSGGVVDIEIAAVWDSGHARPPGFAAESARRFQIPHCVERLEDLLDLVDGVIIHSVDWDQHVQQAACFLEAGKSVLLDKPMVGNVKDARRLIQWSREGKRITGGSSLRFAAQVSQCRAQGEIHGVFGGCGTDEFGYGIHGYAMLCGLMGQGLESARCVATGRQTIVYLGWRNGRWGVLALGGAKLPPHFTARGAGFLTQRVIDSSILFRPYLEQCVPYLAGVTEAPPLPISELLEPELAAIAALKSKAKGGLEVRLSDLSDEDPGYDGAAYASAYISARGGHPELRRSIVGPGTGSTSCSHADTEPLLDSVVEEFGLGELRAFERLGGTSLPRFSLQTSKGRFVVRFRHAEFASEPYIRFDHEVLRRLARAGLPVPSPLSRRDGTSWIHLDAGTLEVLSWIDGQPFHEGDRAGLRNLGACLSRFHQLLQSNPPAGKEGVRREDHPDLLKPYLEALVPLCRNDAERREVGVIARELEHVRVHLDGGLYERLPKTVIHGDVHPGNFRFSGGQVSAIYDFDYMNRQARVRDVVDAILFFAARRCRPLDPDDLRSLTQPMRPEPEWCVPLLQGYESLCPLSELEWEAIPLLIRSQWLQIRLRGARKVPASQRRAFVVEGFFIVLDWLNGEAAEMLERVRGEGTRLQ